MSGAKAHKRIKVHKRNEAHKRIKAHKRVKAHKRIKAHKRTKTHKRIESHKRIEPHIKIETLKGDGDNSGNYILINDNFLNQNPSEPAPFSLESSIHIQNSELPSLTEIRNIIFAPPEKVRKPFIVRHYSKETENSKTNSISCEEFNNLGKTVMKPKNDLLNKKTERKNYENDINEENFPQIETNKKDKNEDKFINEEELNKNNLMNKILKPFCKSLRKYVKKMGNIKEKLGLGNLSRIFHGVKYNRKVLDLPLFQIFCFEGCQNNYYILRRAKPENQNKKLFKDILNEKFKVLLEYFYENKESFDVHNNGEILKFPKIDEKLKEALKDEEDEEIINMITRNTKLMTKVILHDFKHPAFDERETKGQDNIDIDSIWIKQHDEFEIEEKNQEDESTYSEEKKFKEIMAKLFCN